MSGKMVASGNIATPAAASEISGNLGWRRQAVANESSLTLFLSSTQRAYVEPPIVAAAETT